MEDVRTLLHWRTPEGCERCRPVVCALLIEVWQQPPRSGRAMRVCAGCAGPMLCGAATRSAPRIASEVKELVEATSVEVALSACRHACTVGDALSVIADGSGWELRWAGAPVSRVHGERELLESCASLLQLYIEERGELEQPEPFMDRVGADYLCERVMKDPLGRSLLADRFLGRRKDESFDLVSLRRARGRLEADPDRKSDAPRRDEEDVPS